MPPRDASTKATRSATGRAKAKVARQAASDIQPEATSAEPTTNEPTSTEPTTTERLDIRQLAALSNHSIRTVRYYITQGLIDRPNGVRRGAWYDQRHLQQLLKIHHWRRSGVGLERVRELQAGAPDELPPRPTRAGTIEAWSRVTISDGLEIHIEPHRATLSPEQLRQFVVAVTAAYRKVRVDEESMGP